MRLLMIALAAALSLAAQVYPPSGSGGGGSSPITASAPIVKTGNNLTCSVANSSQAGCLAAADFLSFTSKQAALGFTPDHVITFSDGLTRTSNNVACDVANGIIAGCLSPSDYATFAAKQAALAYTPENVANKDTDGTLAANSDTKYASQKATKTYVDTGLAAKENSLGFVPENSANKGIVNGYASLDSSGRVPIDQLPTVDITPGYNPAQVISGCGVEYTSGLIFQVGVCTYTINGATYSSAATTVTLGAADVTNPRIDVIAVDVTGVVVVLAGTPASSPVQPTLDASTQLELTFVTVAANATTPSDVTTDNIYDENTEWTTSVTAHLAAASTTNPYHLTKDIEATAAVLGNNVQLVKPAAGTIDLGSRNALVFYIRSKAAWPTGASGSTAARYLAIFWQSGSTQKGSQVILRDGAFGFSSSTTSAYQQISIPTSLFGINGISVTTLRIQVAGNSGSSAIGFYIDEISLQGGLTGPVLPATLMNFRGVWTSTTSYSPNDLVTVATGQSYVALLASTNVAVTTAATWKPLIASLPLANGGTHADLSATGGTHQVLKQSTSGANITVGQLACSDLSDGGAGCSGTGSTPSPMTFGICVGSPCVVASSLTPPFIITSTRTISKCYIAALTAPVGASLIVDILKNGSSIFGANPKLTLTTTSTGVSSLTVFGTSSFAENDKVTVDTTQVGSTTAGQDVELVCTF